MKPSVLVSFAYLGKFLAGKVEGSYRDWVLDSGAYSALTSGKVIHLEDYITSVLGLAEPPKEVFALDVIGDPEVSIRNTERMWEAGIEAVPTFHYGSPWKHLENLSKTYQKIALGGLVARGKNAHGGKIHRHEKLRWLEQCFARVWPKWIHGFGCCDRMFLQTLPFASVDSTTWYYGPSRYGAIQFAGRYFDPRTTKKALPSQAENRRAFSAGVAIQLQWHLDLEQETRSRWGGLLKKNNLGQFDLRLGVTSGKEISENLQSE